MIKPTKKNTPKPTQNGFITLLLILLVIGLVAIAILALYMRGLDIKVREKFEGQRWELPAQVYARPLALYDGAPVKQADLISELKLLQYSKVANAPTPGTWDEAGNQVTIHSRKFDFASHEAPSQTIDIAFNGNKIAAVQSNAPLFKKSNTIDLEPLLIGNIYPRHNEDRVLIKVSDAPDVLIKALIATEDRQFYSHYGISPRGLTRAIIKNASGGHKQGGSTLTQQLVKNFYLSSERSLKRKANEALMAILLEVHYSKNSILETYLNEVNLGQNGNVSINGFGLAAKFYFGKPLDELTTSQQALLVGLVNGPSLYNPWRAPEAALTRRNIVLHNMLVTGNLTQAQYNTAIKQPLGILVKPAASQAVYPDFMDLVRRQLKDEYPVDEMVGEGFKVFTTLDPVVQKNTQTAFNQSIQQLIQANPKKLKGLEGAALIADPQTGHIVSAIGGTKGFTGFNRAVDAKRPIGSLVKPAVYLTALQTQQYFLGSMLEDVPITLNGDNGAEWTPKNYDQFPHGTVNFMDALAHSYNLATVQLGNAIGLTNVIKTLKSLGVEDNIPNFPSVFLGALNLSPYRVLNMYQIYAAGGTRHPLTAINKVISADGQVIPPSGDVEATTAIEPGSAYLINTALQRVAKIGTASKLNAIWPNHNLAGKTGTTNESRDAWFAGYGGNYAGVVWLGHDNNKPIGLSGGSGALPVWINMFKQLNLSPVKLNMPNTLQTTWIDHSNGLLTDESCSTAINIPLFISTTPVDTSLCIPAASTEISIEESLDPLATTIIKTEEAAATPTPTSKATESAEPFNFNR